VIASGYLGSLLLSGSYLAVSSATSALTRNQVISMVLSVMFCLFLILAGWPPVTNLLVKWAPAALVQGVASFSVIPYFETLQKGVVDLKSATYFLSIMALGFSPPPRSSGTGSPGRRSRKMHQGKRLQGFLLSAAGLVLLALILVAANFAASEANVRLDCSRTA
jgi:hypothetical protein